MEQLEPQFPTVDPEDVKSAYHGKGLPDGEMGVILGFRLFLLRGAMAHGLVPNLPDRWGGPLPDSVFEAVAKVPCNGEDLSQICMNSTEGTRAYALSRGIDPDNPEIVKRLRELIEP